MMSGTDCIRLTLFLSSDELSLQVGLLVFNVCLLYVKHLEVPREFLVFEVQVLLLLQLLEKLTFLIDYRPERGLLIPQNRLSSTVVVNL